MSPFRCATLAVLGLLLLVPAAAPAATGTDCVGADDPVTSANIRASERALLCLVNVYRSAAEVPVLTADPALGRAARNHSEHMEAKGRFGHRGIGDGSPSSRARAEGFPCEGNCVGENIAFSGFPGYSARDMFIQWQNSPGHDRNMLGSLYVTGGMGFALGENFGLTGTQNFAYVDGGGTDTAADLLTSPACDAASAREAEARARVARRRKSVEQAAGEQKREARRKLRRAKARAKAVAVQADAACDLRY